MANVDVTYKLNGIKRNASAFFRELKGRPEQDRKNPFGQMVDKLGMLKVEKIQRRIKERNHIYTSRMHESVGIKKQPYGTNPVQIAVRIGTASKPDPTLRKRGAERRGNNYRVPFWWRFLVYGNSRQPPRPLFESTIKWFPSFDKDKQEDFQEAILVGKKYLSKFFKSLPKKKG